MVGDYTPVNLNSPIRLAFLGGSEVGKSSLASKLITGQSRETYYPTHINNAVLFPFMPQSANARSILDECNSLQNLKQISSSPNILLSPVVYKSLRNGSSSAPMPKKRPAGSTQVSTNDVYSCHKSDPASSAPPEISPILVELVDTPPFHPDQVVPFLEASLYIKLDPEILCNLANEPRRPVTTNPLLVASGAGELNGHIDGYFLIYSSVPSSLPPSYDDIIASEIAPHPTDDLSAITSLDSSVSKLSFETTNTRSSMSSGSSSGSKLTRGEESLNLLGVIKGALGDAWKEFRNYKRRWEMGKEGDVYSLVYSIKQIWKEHRYEEELNKGTNRDRSFLTKLEDLNEDPSDPESPPPIWIVATHIDDPRSSPLMVEQGRKLAASWKCGFVAVGSDAGENVEESVSLMIRDIVERRKLVKKQHPKKRSS